MYFDSDSGLWKPGRSFVILWWQTTFGREVFCRNPCLISVQVSITRFYKTSVKIHPQRNSILGALFKWAKGNKQYLLKMVVVKELSALVAAFRSINHMSLVQALALARM